ncbi:ArsC family protein [Streptococcus porcinus]|uniref:Arsenate reductase family protein n=1 Tax=Streptococcus porcinus TaxID=1340 RepID=A0A4U9ZBQ9_STRPO|nr:arsenate reductase family protein [Streptococcus porcinus]MBA2795445.1 arsenate reductase family protein [Streptococcus porcinus]VTS37382.1 ArsC family protein [Streptococcus porcinus]
MYTFYEYPKCSTCRKAKAELKQYLSDFETVDIKSNPPRAELLKQWMENSDFPMKNFFNTSGHSYRELGLKDKIDCLTLEEATQLLAQDGMLIKRPILVKDDKVLQIGSKQSYERFFK